MKDWLQLNGLWRLVSGSEKKPVGTPQVLDSKGNVQTAAVPPDEDKLERWEVKAERAAGALKTATFHELRVLIRDCEDNPILIWSTLKAYFVQQRTAPRCNAYHTLLSTQRDDSESLDSLINKDDEQIGSALMMAMTASSSYRLSMVKEVEESDFMTLDSFDDVVRTISVLDKFHKQFVIQLLRNMDHTRFNLSGTSSAFAVSQVASKQHPKVSLHSHSPSSCLLHFQFPLQCLN